MNDRIAGDRAVVLGGSMAGLLAARVLSEAYSEVIVVERDELPAEEAPRRGVPQGRHIHGLIGRGQQILDELLPGFTPDLVARGAPPLDQLADARMYLRAHPLRRARGGPVVVSASRPCLEGYVRERVRSLPGVVFADQCDAVGFTTTPVGDRITGARVHHRDDTRPVETLDADLVVDTTGRGSRTPRWLEDLGYERPAEDRVAADVAYATALLCLRPGALRGDRAVIVPPAAEHRRGGGLAAIEDGRHILTLMGILGDRPPTTADGFFDYAKSLRVPDIYAAVRDAEVLRSPVAIRFPASTRRRYERLARFPDGLLVLGDSLCSLNPVYGQGMGVAALEALVLRSHLGHPPQTRKVLRDMARAVDPAWDIAAGADLAFPGVEGTRSLKIRVANAYIPRLHAAAEYDAALGAAFLRVAALQDRPGALFRPGVVFRVAKNALRPPAHFAR